MVVHISKSAVCKILTGMSSGQLAKTSCGAEWYNFAEWDDFVIGDNEIDSDSREILKKGKLVTCPRCIEILKESGL